jgi:hypothetical protein
MSWPSTDFELAIETELKALRKLEVVARLISLKATNVDFTEASVPSRLVRELREALAEVPEEQST